KKRDKAVLGVNYNFIVVEEHHFFGLTKEGVGNNTYYVTDKEKTIIDCLLKPIYSGEYPDLIHAIGNTTLNESKLIAYCQKIDSGALNKRLGYFLELSSKSDYAAFIEYALRNKTKGYNLLDPQGSKEGKYTTKWDLCVNIDEKAILSMMNEKLY
ncbi:MAG TPA: hypothetical protein PKD85_21975, partial [Saprospiraceae bacterium]|nr:hypothetical protein [Saprospiraceae bacterium]